MDTAGSGSRGLGAALAHVRICHRKYGLRDLRRVLLVGTLQATCIEQRLAAGAVDGAGPSWKVRPQCGAEQAWRRSHVPEAADSAMAMATAATIGQNPSADRCLSLQLAAPFFVQPATGSSGCAPNFPGSSRAERPALSQDQLQPVR